MRPPQNPNNPWKPRFDPSSGSNIVALITPGGSNLQGGGQVMGGDSAASKPREDLMSDISREEVNAKLEAAEARVETRFAILDGKLDRLLDKSVSMDSDIREAKDAAIKARDAATSVTWHLIFVALGTIGAVIAIYAFGVQLLDLGSGMVEALKKP